ncbi:hypothetical protein ACHHYP_16558 [Achlya hypogyna]|uniref:RING-type domain-containing protein n=1 Tax=Achlya hypogyna TaxID=1202772 RepID=A0A1V9ZE04_ACHHY|nr:hypothetical protein ACHHYP_16558 [Achlya hypogyna]
MSFVPTRPGRRDSRTEGPEGNDSVFVGVAPGTSPMLRSTGEISGGSFDQALLRQFPTKPDETQTQTTKTRFQALRRQSIHARKETPKESISSFQRNLAALTTINTKERNDAILARQELDRAKGDIEALKGALVSDDTTGELQTLYDNQRSRASSRESSTNNPRAKTPVITPEPSSNNKTPEMDTKLRTLETQHHELLSTNRQLVRQLQKAETHAKLTQATLTGTQSSLDAASREVTALQDRVARLQAEAHGLAAAEATSKADSLGLTLATENTALRHQVVQAHEELNAVALRERQARAGLHDEIGVLTGEKALVAAHVAKLNAAIAAITEEHEAATAKLVHLESVHAILEAQVRTLMDTNLELTSEKTALADALAQERSSDVRKERDNLQAQCCDLTATIGKLETDLLLERNIGSRKQSMLDQYKASLAATTTQIETLVRQAALLEQAQPRDEQSLLHRLVDAPASANATVAALQLARSGKDEALAILADEKAALARELQMLREEHDALRHQATENQRAATLQSQLHELVAKHTELLRAKDEAVADAAKARTDATALRVALNQLQATASDPAAAALLVRAHDELRSTVQSIVQAEASSESTFTCLACMQVLTEPMTLVGCGHTFCRACVVRGQRDSKIVCKECRYECMEKSLFENHALADLAARFIFRQQALAALSATCQELGAAFQATVLPRVT